MLQKKSSYPKKSAGRLMTVAVPTVDVDATVGDIKQLLVDKASTFATINYIYITDTKGLLTGVVSLRELYGMADDIKAQTLSPEKVIVAHMHTDQEHIVLLALRHNLKAIPVVGKNREFLGAVSSDVILTALHTKSIEDVLRLAGAGRFDNPAEDLIHAGVLTHFRKRAPWLFVGLLGGVAAAFVVGFFEESLAEQLILVAFIPAVVYMADAVGSQTQMIFVRSLSLGNSFVLKNYIQREVLINGLLAFLLGCAMFVLTYVWIGSLLISSVLGISIAVTIMISMIIAIGIPLILQKCKLDPAIASGPPATVSRDIISLIVYFAIATLFI